MGKKEDGGGLSEIDKQQLSWMRYERPQSLFEKAEKIIKALGGKSFWLKELSEEHDVYSSYIFIAIRKLGYRETRRRGTASAGLDFFYERK